MDDSVPQKVLPACSAGNCVQGALPPSAPATPGVLQVSACSGSKTSGGAYDNVSMLFVPEPTAEHATFSSTQSGGSLLPAVPPLCPERRRPLGANEGPGDVAGSERPAVHRDSDAACCNVFALPADATPLAHVTRSPSTPARPGEGRPRNETPLSLLAGLESPTPLLPLTERRPVPGVEARRLGEPVPGVEQRLPGVTDRLGDRERLSAFKRFRSSRSSSFVGAKGFGRLCPEFESRGRVFFALDALWFRISSPNRGTDRPNGFGDAAAGLKRGVKPGSLIAPALTALPSPMPAQPFRGVMNPALFLGSWVGLRLAAPCRTCRPRGPDLSFCADAASSSTARRAACAASAEMSAICSR